ncbi:hypothetical protein PIB30_090608 [Stylosanthes scabra]|uniref:Uncharacterized protein n=1 Tax=Stylosanthes scabra TaxID=79078 RepID=A0ABU6QXP0_9FABA|nr:hypothetical protein [Stylosanthes scabra]
MGIHSLQDYIPEGRFRAIGKLRVGRTFGRQRKISPFVGVGREGRLSKRKRGGNLSQLRKSGMVLHLLRRREAGRKLDHPLASDCSFAKESKSKSGCAGFFYDMQFHLILGWPLSCLTLLPLKGASRPTVKLSSFSGFPD